MVHSRSNDMDMNNTLTIAELKRRGMAAIEDGLKHGPVRIMKRNKSAAVVLTPDEYERLSRASQEAVPGMTALDWLLGQKAGDGLSREQADQRLREERDW